ncbi:hypothetical protein QE372_005264 [Agrobacterium pusense]|uniref:hypothetical protein n=1 Tax=Agrobacterium pusense TaxID=648995 RepID=UPI002860A1AC|nr:hypothetical protein [Agrobacterium pusense]MDR6192930.1 hypothetical protein [Agrobacterium pusense]
MKAKLPFEDFQVLVRWSGLNPKPSDLQELYAAFAAVEAMSEAVRKPRPLGQKLLVEEAEAMNAKTGN